MSDLLDSVISNSPVAPAGGEPGGGKRAEQKIEAGEHSRVSLVEMNGQVSKDATLNQEISLGDNSTATQLSLKANIYVSDTDYYFELLPSELRETAKGAAPSYEPLSPDAQLRAGQKYRIRVSLSKNPYSSLIQSGSADYRLKQRSFKLPKAVFVQLSLGSQDQSALDAVGSISPSQGRLSLDDLTQYQDFEFTIEKDYALDITLELLYLGGPNAKLAYPAATLSLRLEGKEPLPPPPKILQLSTKVAPPPDAVVLYVSEGNEGSLMLRGWLGGRSDGSLTLEVGAFGWVDPEDCVNVETYLQKLRDSFYDYNIDRAASVAAWFEKALQRFDKQCSILIVDEAGALIPWEMFKLPDGRYLGAHALIVRWAEAQYAVGQESDFVGDAKYEGRLSAYVHPLDVARMCQLPEMSRLLPSYHQTPLNLQRDLRSGGDQVGLVYLCYGGVLDYGDEENCITQLSRFKPYQEDVRIRFDLLGGKLKPRPIFFVNAPYSGRMHKSGQQWCGLARATLKQVAASYIGTLGPVDPSYAARFAQKLLEEATSDKGVKPAQLLREMRVQAIEQLNNEELSEEDYERAYKELAYPFMYVHYGHPQDWLKITRAPEPAEAEGGDEHV